MAVDDPTFGGLISDPLRLQHWFDGHVPGGAAPIALGACEATWAAPLTAVINRMQMESLYFIIPRWLRKKGERYLSPPGFDYSYWNCALMPLVLLASFDSPKWH